MNTIRIAFRNMKRQTKRTTLLTGAIAFVIFIVSMINGLSGGIVGSVKENVSHMMAGHIYITGAELSPGGREVQIIRDDTALVEAVGELGIPVKYITKRSSVMGTLIFGSREVNQRIDGVNWNEESYFKDKLMLNKGSLDELDNPRSLILSENAARKLGIQVGESLLIRLATATGQQNVDEFKLIATTVDQSFIGNMTAYAHLSYINQLLNLESNEYQSLNIFLENMESIDAAKARLQTLLAARVQLTPDTNTEENTGEDNNAAAGGTGTGGHFSQGRRAAAGGMMSGLFNRKSRESWEGTRYTITTLNDMMSVVMNLITFLNGFSLVILIILLIIITIGITNTFRMILIERVREIGTIRALGMQKQGVANIFLLEAFFICITGAVIGCAIAFTVMFLLSLLRFPTNTMFFLFLSDGHPSFSLNPGQMILNIGLIAFFTILAALAPAVKAARLDPAKALGTHY